MDLDTMENIGDSYYRFTDLEIILNTKYFASFRRSY